MLLTHLFQVIMTSNKDTKIVILVDEVLHILVHSSEILGVSKSIAMNQNDYSHTSKFLT